MTPRGGSPLRQLLAVGDDLTVLLAPGTTRASLDHLGLGAGTTVRDLTDPASSPVPRPRGGTVLLVALDRAGLRRAVTAVSDLGAADRVGCWLQRPSPVLPSVGQRQGWPPLTEVTARSAPETFVLATFARPAPVRSVLAEISRRTTPQRLSAPGWPVLGARSDEPARWPVADPAAVVGTTAELADHDVDYPPDLVLVETGPDGTPDPHEAHPVLGRMPVTAVTGPDLTWEAMADLSGSEQEALLSAQGPLSLGPLDEQVLNPMGFHRMSAGAAVPLRPVSGSRDDLAADTAQGTLTLPVAYGVSDSDLPTLRTVPGLRLGWEGTSGPHAYCRVVAGLAMAGVPLVCDDVPGWARHLLAPELVSALESEAHLDDPLTREEHSVRLRRAALSSHASRPWRRALARRHGLQETPSPRVSVLLPTRRPEMLSFALRQVARQRGVDLELLLVTHGFEADPAELDRFRAHSDVPLTALSAPTDMLFGAVLNLAAARAQGDVLLKMDDDDWYGPEFVSDLLLAREYSDAEVVGCPPEFTFVEPLWLTTRRQDATEQYRRFVAGGTILVDRSAFRAVGGFRETRKYVDACLLSAVIDAGGDVYRSHGLGYVLRRTGQGHTWDPGLGYFVARSRSWYQWRGLHASALLEPDPADLPEKPRYLEVTT